jgi:hypothetical protein
VRISAQKVVGTGSEQRVAGTGKEVFAELEELWPSAQTQRASLAGGQTEGPK